MLTNSLAATAVGLIVLSGTAYAGVGGGKNCDDFDYREDAQAYFDEKGYSADNDPEQLDSDNDGKACELRPSRSEEDEPARDDSDEDSEDSKDEDSGDSDSDSDEDADDSEDESTSQVTTIPRGSVEAGGA